MRWWQIRKRDADLDRELRSDLELEQEEQRERGLSPEEAALRGAPRIRQHGLNPRTDPRSLGVGSCRAPWARRSLWLAATAKVSRIHHHRLIDSCPRYWRGDGSL